MFILEALVFVMGILVLGIMVVMLGMFLSSLLEDLFR